MAYFPNGTAGACFDRQCMRCRYGDAPCPIALVQGIYNYPACNNETASAILGALVSDSGECSMYKLDPDWFENRQMKLNLPE